MKISGIYKILNTITNKVYIGSAVDCNRRFIEHRKNLKANDHRNSYLQNAYNKYGLDAFQFIVIEACETSKLIELEQSWINWTKCCNENFGYNLNPTAGSNLGKKFSEDFKKKARARQIGKKLSEETKLRIVFSSYSKKKTS